MARDLQMLPAAEPVGRDLTLSLGRDLSGPSKTEAALRGAAQGVSLGWADELAGGLGGLSKVQVPDELLGVPDAQMFAAGMELGSGKLGENYRDARNEYRS